MEVPLKPQLVEQLGRVIDPSRVTADPAERARLGSDALGPSRGLRTFDPSAHLPDVVVRPLSLDEVVALVRFASDHRLPLIPLGGGSGLMGGVRAIRGGILLDMTGMQRVLAISVAGRSVTVEAGATLAAIDAALAPSGQMLGHDPWTVSIATVGGAISTNGLGYRGARFGPMRDQVLGLTAVLPNGTVVRTPAVPTHSTGPDLTRLFVGAEGTLGVIVEATLRTFPLPEASLLAAFSFPSFEAGFTAVTQIAEQGLQPSLLDLGEDVDAGVCQLFLGFEGLAGATREAMDRAVAACLAQGATRLSNASAEEFWHNRHQYGDWYAEARRNGQTWARPGYSDYVHVAIPADQVLEYRRRCIDHFAEGPVELAEVGLWTGPELVSLVLRSRDDAGRQPYAALAAGVDWAIRTAQELGGSMEYCHGVGIRLAHAMQAELGAGLDVLRRIKQTLDPLGIMNPGKLGL